MARSRYKKGQEKMEKELANNEIEMKRNSKVFLSNLFIRKKAVNVSRAREGVIMYEEGMS